MKKLWLGTLTLFAVVGLMTVGCDKMDPLVSQDGVVTTSACVPKVVTIWAGQHIDVGTVTVTNCSESLYVKYEATAPWKFTEMHLAVANTCAELPRNPKGHLVPGLFPYAMTFDPPVTEYTFAIPLGDWEPGDSICIAAHCVVVTECGGNETGWGDVWKGCFWYGIQECYKDVRLPCDSVRMRALRWPPGQIQSTWRIELANVPPGYDVWNGDQWKGWCAEERVGLNESTWHRVKLYSSQNPAIQGIPRLWMNGEWDRVNWVLNHKSNYPTAIWSNFQVAIWHLLGVRPGTPTNPLTLQIYTDAVDNGDGYHPGPGGWVAVLAADGPCTQLVFFEVDP